MHAKDALAVIGMAGICSWFGATAQAEENGLFSLRNATLDVRYRAEFVDQDGLAENALASTIRTRVGYKFTLPASFSAYADVENIRVIGADKFNSTSNGNGEFPVVADPEDTELNQAFLAWSGIDGTVVKYGRQRVNLDNQRFIGAVGWRQNEQTFDGLSVKSAVNDDVTVFAAHFTNANRIFGDSHPNPALSDLNITAQLVNVAWKVGDAKITPYAYLVEFDQNAAASNTTTGLRVQGKRTIARGERPALGLSYLVDLAQQSDFKDGAATIDHHYLHASLGLTANKLNVKAGYELLGSNNGTSSFSMPLSTLHKFNGWADVFLSTPANGLRDTYVSAGGFFRGVKMAAIYHDFSADVGGASYGDEINLVASRQFGKNYSALLKYASYSADELATDRRRIWLQVGAKF
ncbi:MAG: alginate export family protein [Gammaproteobacteria bacterium]